MPDEKPGTPAGARGIANTREDLPSGGRKWRHHQWFTPDPGYIKLNQHIAGTMALMRASANWSQFRRAIQRAYPKLRDQLDFDFGGDG